MNKFIYVAKNLEGKKIKGTYIAEDESYVRESLAKNQLFIVSIKKISKKAPSAFFSISGRVGINELTSFCKQFSVLISSGISIIDSINTLKNQPYSNLLRKTLQKVEDDLYEGMMLSESMKKYPKAFPKFFSSMIYVGETSGKLDEVLISVANYYTRERKNKNKLKSALAYPIVLFLLMIGVMVVMLHFVIPTFISSFSAMDIEMPWLTMALFNLSTFFRYNWQYIGLTIVIVLAIIYLFSKTEKGRLFIDRCKVTLPIFKKINMAIFTSQLVQSLGLLLGSGLDIITSLEAISNIINNKYLESQFNRVILDVKKGIPLSTAISLEMKLSAVVTEMIAVGEKTGKTDKMLLQTNEYFDQEVEKALGLISTLVQPILLAILGAFIAIMFVAMYLPILSMITSIKT
ncbi:MAG TPA: hypothetical protein DCO89_03180 [Clostridiales bacterium]|nr:hypothetical protein [Clostridiales bacterium]